MAPPVHVRSARGIGGALRTSEHARQEEEGVEGRPPCLRCRAEPIASGHAAAHAPGHRREEGGGHHQQGHDEAVGVSAQRRALPGGVTEDAPRCDC
jgi:hypothetical protein